MDTETVLRIADNVDMPQRRPRTRDNRARERRDVQALIDAYQHGYTDELSD
jgi:hypothetical protein